MLNLVNFGVNIDFKDLDYINDITPQDYYNMSYIERFNTQMMISYLEYNFNFNGSKRLKELDYTERRVKYLVEKDGDDLYFDTCKDLEDYFQLNILRIKKLEKMTGEFKLTKINRSLFLDVNNNILGFVDRKVY